MRERLTYSFGPLERRGIAGSFAAGQVTVLAAGALLAILALDHFPSAGGATLATLICVLAGAIAFVPVGGRPAQEWLPIALRFGAAKITGDDRFLTSEPTAGMSVAGHHTVAGARRLPWRGRRHAGERDGADLRMPAQLRGVRVVPTAYRERPIGILTERSGRLATAVLACRVGSFSLLDHDAQERRLSRWGLVLSGAGGGRSGGCSGSSAPRRRRATSWPAGFTPSGIRRSGHEARR
jgi:hypothetical protein